MHIRGPLIAAATALVLLGASVVPFATPAYVRAEQGRVGVEGLTGYGPAELDTIIGSVLENLFLWSGDFDVTIDGIPVLSERERGHMRDVRNVVGAWIAVVAVAIIVLARAAWRSRGNAEARFGAWRAAGTGARAMAVVVIVLGTGAAVAFDVAFELFHRLFFSGNYTFDPRTDRLVQLFPEQFWSDTVLFLGRLLLALIVAVVAVSSRRTYGVAAQVPLPAARAA